MQADAASDPYAKVPIVPNDGSATADGLLVKPVADALRLLAPRRGGLVAARMADTLGRCCAAQEAVTSWWNVNKQNVARSLVHLFSGVGSSNAGVGCAGRGAAVRRRCWPLAPGLALAQLAWRLHLARRPVRRGWHQ